MGCSSCEEATGSLIQGCFYFLPFMTNATMNICIQVFVWTYVFIFLEYLPMNRIAGSYGN